MAIVDEIYQQFIDYFGEDRVDLQRYSPNTIKVDSYHSSNCSATDYIIVVHWPVVTVANEFDNTIDIWDLYSITVIASTGKLRMAPEFSRSTYDKLQWASDYMHSHVSSIGKNDLSRFHASCLGSGPINNTIKKLEEDSYTDPDIWNLYCWELDKYVAVESISGVPYHRMQNLGASADGRGRRSEIMTRPNLGLDTIPEKNILRDFIRHLIESNILKFAYFEGKYTLAATYIDAVLNISNCFIDFYNTNSYIRKLRKKEKLFDNGFIQKMFIRDGVIYDKNDSNVPIEAAIGTTMFTFKGNPVKLQLKDFHQDYSSCEVYLLNLDIVDYIIYVILKHVNLKYGKTTDTTVKNARII